MVRMFKWRAKANDFGYKAWWQILRHDVRYASRTLVRNPGFTVAAVLTLALGIGANTAIFSVINNALLRPLPVPRPNQLAALFNFNKKTSKYVSTSYLDYEYFARHAKSFEQLSAYVRLPFDLTIGSHTERIPGEPVSTNYFSMLDLAPVAGRDFEPGDINSSLPVALISESLWRERFGGKPGLIGKTLVLDNHPAIVVGVVPKRYRGANLNWSAPPQIWITMNSLPVFWPQFKALFNERRSRWLLMIGRLKAYTTVAQAQAELQILAANLAQMEPTTNRDITAVAFPAARAKFWPAYRNSVTQSLAVFAGASALLLLLACANVSNLLLERALGRRREIAIRLSIGATRSRLVRQLMTESLLLVLMSCLSSLLVAYGLQNVLLHFPAALGLPLTLDPGVDGSVLAFCVLLSLSTVALFGLAPALQATKPDVMPVLKESGNTGLAADRGPLRNSLVVVQVAFSMVLLVGGGLFARTLLKAYAIDLGFRSNHLLTLSFDLPKEEYSDERGRRFIQDLIQQVSNLSGVESATNVWDVPLSGMHSTIQVLRADGPTLTPLSVEYNMVGPEFLRTTGIDLLRGRDFNSHDNAKSARVAIINRTMAEQLWPGADSVGRSILVEEKQGERTPVQIVGVARDSKYRSIWEQPEPYLYIAAAQSGSGLAASHLIVRTQPEPMAMEPAIRELWGSVAPHVPLYDIRTGDEQVNFSLTPQRFAADFFVSFGMLGISLTSLGLYGVLAYSVVRRTREIGIRIAIGARPQVVVREIVGKALLLVLVGLGFGLGASFVLMHFVASMVKDISPYDGATLVAVSLLLVTVAIVAALAPALRAARVDPVTALRYE